jgi:hypothetical protein
MKLSYDFCQQQLKKESRRRRSRRRSQTSVCVIWRNFAKFRAEKYDFDPYRGSIIQQRFKWHKFARFRRILFFKSPNFYDKFPVGSQEYKRIFYFYFWGVTFISSM